MPARKNKLVIPNLKPHAKYPIPEAEEFDGHEYVRANDLQQLCNRVIQHFNKDFGYLHSPDSELVKCFWRAKGGTSNGKKVYGRCIKLTGLLKFSLQAEYAVWFAADHCREVDFTRFQSEALMFHELLHTGVDKKDQLISRGHDYEVFQRELEEYGTWEAGLSPMIAVARLLPFDQS